MSVEIRQYEPISQRAFNEIRENLSRAGVVLDNLPKGGPIDATHGFKVSWDYLPGTLRIVLDGNDKSWYATMNMAWDKIEEQIHPYVGR